VQLQSLPTTLIEIHSIRERLPVFSQGAQMDNLLTALTKHQRRPVDLLDCPKKLDLLSDLVNPTDISGRYLRLHCRVKFSIKLYEQCCSVKYDLVSSGD
jgi:hypothetical protein